uniref:Uncharacterized protein n=1 Tax=Haplochromis burtoni TaxID=8153 RepID=A0A3Q2VNM6_HAPBU
MGRKKKKKAPRSPFLEGAATFQAGTGFTVSDFVCHRCPGYHDSRSELLCRNVLRCVCVYLCPRSSGVSYPRSTSLHMDGLFL